MKDTRIRIFLTLSRQDAKFSEVVLLLTPALRPSISLRTCFAGDSYSLGCGSAALGSSCALSFENAIGGTVEVT
jgi:demethoxyubiquinone hydroxylase (CLK1/Coq7/Cat5 family)